MHQDIMTWPSDHLYGSKLEADASVAHHLLRDLPGVESTDDTSVALLLIDTAGCNMRENIGDDDISKANDGEAAIVVSHVKALVAAGVATNMIGVITPYNLQVERLRHLLSDFPAIEIKSVDGFQVN